MTAPELRPYQREVIEQFHGAVAAGKRRIILVAPTGSGKTVIGADIIRTITRAQKPVLVLAHRREIIAQTSREAARVRNLSHGIIQAGFSRARWNWCRSHRSKPCGCAASTPARWTCRPPTCW